VSFWQLHISTSLFVGVGIAVGVADGVTLGMFTDEIFHVCHTTVTNTYVKKRDKNWSAKSV
jgi:hypothetical protein